MTFWRILMFYIYTRASARFNDILISLSV